MTVANKYGNYFERQKYRIERKAQIAAEKAAKDRDAMTCQCCGRRIFAQTGTIAHHGYERPGTGWQTASCMGAKKMPFEVARETLALMIERIKYDIVCATEHLVAVREDKTEVPFRWSTYAPTGRLGMTKMIGHQHGFMRLDFEKLVSEIKNHMMPLLREHTIYGKEYKEAEDALDPMHAAMWKKMSPRTYGIKEPFTFNILKDAEIQSTRTRINQLKSFLADQQKRYDDWEQTHSHFDTSTKAWVPVR